MLKWAKPPINRYIDYVEETGRILYLYINGIRSISRMVPLVEALYQPGKTNNVASEKDDYEKRLEETKERASFAQEEIDKGFPILIAHTVVTLYSSLEILAYDLARVWMINVPEVLEKEHFSRIKISLTEYERLDKENRMDYLLSQYSKHINADMKLGVGKFEAILDSVSLSGSVDDGIRREILELSQVRNIVVHRGRYVDRRFKETCPWVPTDIGEKHICRLEDFNRYREASSNYVFGLIDRIRNYFGVDPYKEGDDGT